MIGKTKTGRGFKGTIYYCLDQAKKPEILDTNGLSHSDAKGLTREFVAISSENQSISKPVWHTSLAFTSEDKMTNERMAEIANCFMRKAGFTKDNNQWVIIKHNDTPHTHCHIVASRVGFDGKAISDFYFKSRTVQWAKELEHEFNLVKVQELSQKRRNERAQLKPFDQEKENLKRTLNGILKEPGVNSFQKLESQLRKHGIEMQIHCHSKTGRAYGISFRVGDKVYKGSDMGKEYTINSLNQKLTLLPSQVPTIRIVKTAAKIISRVIEAGLGT